MQKHQFTGFQSPAQDYLRQPLSLDGLLIRFPLSTFFCRFEGEAMSGFGINPGDLLVVERCSTYQPGQIVLAFVDDQRLVRQLVEFPEGLMLCPANERHKTVPLTEFSQIFGRVIHSITHHLKIVSQLPEAS